VSPDDAPHLKSVRTGASRVTETTLFVKDRSLGPLRDSRSVARVLCTTCARAFGAQNDTAE
jgi:hypothetical protein